MTEERKAVNQEEKCYLEATDEIIWDRLYEEILVAV